MSKIRTTLTIDERIWRAVRVRAARTGRGLSDVVEAALRQDLGFDLLERLWDRSDLNEDEAMALALEAQATVRDQGDT
jgi:plasmid stability protein